MSGGFFPTEREYSRRYGLDAQRMARLLEKGIMSPADAELVRQLAGV